VIWLNFDQRPRAGSYQFQIVSSDAYSWALYYSTEHQNGVDVNGLSGDCSNLVFYACGNSFSGWATFSTPVFLLSTNIYLAIWSSNCGTQSGFSVSFKARYGCGDADVVICEVESGSPALSCNSNGTYNVSIPIVGANGNYQGYDPNATPTTSGIVTLKNLGVGGPTSGTIVMTYPQSVTSYNVLIKDVISPTADIIPTNPDSCILNVTGNGFICNDNNLCTTDGCLNGICVNVPASCDDNNACTIDSCNTLSGCSNILINCNDDDVCTSDACANGICQNQFLCNDNNPCTNDFCRADFNGSCIFLPVSCNDNDFCTVDACNPSNGNCEHHPTDCNDGFECSVDDCIGQCIHNYASCDTVNGPVMACPTRIIFVLDESGSIAGFGQGSVGVTDNVRNGSIGLLNALVGTNSQVAIVEFNTRARRAIIGGSVSYQPVDNSTINNFINYINDNNSIANDNHFDPEDYLVNTQNAFTNWEDALLMVKSINSNEGLANLVIFFTDGMPTAYNTTSGGVITGTSSSVVNAALSKATAAANSVKLQGSHIFVVAFPNPDLPEANVQAISGTQKYPVPQSNFLLADYSITTSSTLESSLNGTGNLICRADLRLSMNASRSIACAGDTITFTLSITNDGHADADTVIVKNYIPSGYTYLSDDGGASTTLLGSVLTWKLNSLLFTQSLSLKIKLLANASGNFMNAAEITYSNRPDNDSKPNNYTAAPVEDDEATASISLPDCNDGNLCTVDFCQFSACVHSPVICDDQNNCTVDVCVSGNCEYSPLNCNDNNACTDDICNALTGCRHTSRNCDDGNTCTDDGCNIATGCTHVPRDCNDNKTCTIDNCVPATGCIHSALNCNDNNACTADGCNEPVGCTSTPVNCSDNDPCTNDICNTQSGCQHTLSNCDDGNACTDDDCNIAIGCSHAPRDCNDNKACTMDNCDPATGCLYIPLNCNDNNACTADGCNNSIGCIHTSVSCNDNDACTDDICIIQLGCQHSPHNCNDNNACTDDGCNSVTGCSHAPRDCNDNKACTTDNCNPATGCIYSALNCNDNNACTTDGCNDSGGCIYAPLNCDDNDACTDDGCNTSTGCTHAAHDCNDNRACTVDNCVPAAGCVYSALNCNDNNACTTDGCNDSDGCVHTPINCDDNDACTDDLCDINGLCRHSQKNCGDGNPCTTDACNAATGNCLNTAISCNDNNPCTADACNNGQCSNIPLNCNDNNTCTIDACSNGQCQNTPDPQCQPCLLEVKTLTLINSSTDLDIRLLKSTDTVNLYNTPNISVRANLCVEPVGSVRFFLNNALYKNENTLPYSIAGDNSGDYLKWNVSPGLYTLKATPYSGANGTGTTGISKTITLLVINQQTCTNNSQCNDNNACTTDACNAGSCVYTSITCNDNNPCTADACVNGVCNNTLIQRVVTSFTLVNAATDLDIGPLNNGAVINLNQTPEVNVRANLCTNTGTASVKFNLNGSQFKIEGSAPWALAGDVSGNYVKWNVAPGNYTIQAIPYSGPNATGTAGTGLSVSISVIKPSSKMSDEKTSHFSGKTFISAYPNPFKTQLNFEFSLVEDSEVSLELFNTAGARIATIFNGKAMGSQLYHEIFHPANLPSGVYFYRLKTNATLITEKVLMTR